MHSQCAFHDFQTAKKRFQIRMCVCADLSAFLSFEYSSQFGLVNIKNGSMILYIKSTFIYTQQNKLRKSQKTMQHNNTKANNYSIFIYLFRYMRSVEINVYFSLLAPIPLLWHNVK